MGIWGRLGNVVKSYLNDESNGLFEKSRSQRQDSESRGGKEWRLLDSDLNAAYEELDDFLRGKPNDKKWATEKPARPVPMELRADFAELGLSPDASAEERKTAYKKLLKAHHPDRHAGKDEAMKKATEKTARVNAAYERIEKWLKN